MADMSPEQRAHAFLCRQYPGLSSIWTNEAHAALAECISAAVEAERERCAAIADAEADAPSSAWAGDIGAIIARAIRTTTTEAGNAR